MTSLVQPVWVAIVVVVTFCHIYCCQARESSFFNYKSVGFFIANDRLDTMSSIYNTSSLQAAAIDACRELDR